MCGIVGYIGERNATPILLDSLLKLEYRGYDSSGVGVLNLKTNKIAFLKTHGKIQNLKQLLKTKSFPKSTIGISHTRWATHGIPSTRNAHPHRSSSGKILIVHNGIIENYEQIKVSLIKKGYKFLSETDTEVIAQLIDDKYRGDIFSAVRNSIKLLKGAFALGVICSDNPETLIAVRVGSPLIIGIGENENFIASDVPAILEHTKKVVYIKDKQMALIKKDDVSLFDFNGKAVNYKIDKIKFKVDAVTKQGYPHFMLKEIYEQPDVIRKIVASNISNNSMCFDGLTLNIQQINSIKNICIVACGTAYHAGLVGKYLIESLASIPVAVDVSSEFRYRDPILDKNTLVIAISQSGETADTLAAVREARRKGSKILSICNVVGSSLARESDDVLYTHAGPEIGVASTKAYTAQLCMLYIFAIKIGISKQKLSRQKAKNLIHNLKRITVLYSAILADKKNIAKIARQNSHFGCFLFLGRNINYPSALEGALKLKEISYIPAEGYAAGEMKHGPIALIDEYRAVVCIAPESEIYEKMISNMQEIRSRKGKIIAIATQGDISIKKHSTYVIYVPKTDILLTPLLVALPLQLIAYYIAVKRGCDVDQPRNLAKSVTVE